MGKENSRMSEEREHSKSKIASRTNGRFARFLNRLFVAVGLIFLAVALPYVVFQLVRCMVVQQSLAYTYAALSVIPFAIGRRKHVRRKLKQPISKTI